MAKAVVSIALVDESEVHPDMGDEVLTPQMIFDQLKQSDPDDLDDLQQMMYDHLWSESGIFAEGGR